MSRVYIDHALLNGKATRPTCIAEHPKHLWSSPTPLKGVTVEELAPCKGDPPCKLVFMNIYTNFLYRQLVNIRNVINPTPFLLTVQWLCFVRLIT